jgi:hypothetical protein
VVWTHPDEDRERWRTLVNEVMNLRVSLKCREVAESFQN